MEAGYAPSSPKRKYAPQQPPAAKAEPSPVLSLDDFSDFQQIGRGK
jgi:hypothetical protein